MRNVPEMPSRLAAVIEDGKQGIIQEFLHEYIRLSLPDPLGLAFSSFAVSYRLKLIVWSG